ncbi:hypothetical protein FJTKL_01775 [Diaporthe vaccinii]|uniref:Uncharacterized protein n=1 Tax=Diaporthe vaccinii TaxID=105482 RepID=A0ABR4F486_9PEZI
MHGALALVNHLEMHNLMLADALSFEVGWFDPGPTEEADMRVLACVDLESEGELPTREEWYKMNYQPLSHWYSPQKVANLLLRLDLTKIVKFLVRLLLRVPQIRALERGHKKIPRYLPAEF